MNNSFVLRGNICHSPQMDHIALYPGGYVVCAEGICKGVFSELPEEYGTLPLVDHGDKLIFPGMTDLHIHAPQYAFRGMCMDLPLMEWLRRYTFPEEEKYESLTYARKAYPLFAGDLRQGAVTRACIFATQHRPATELLMELMEQSGIVSFVGKVNMDRNASKKLAEKSPQASAEATRQWLEGTRGQYQNTKPILTPRFIPSCSDALMEQLREIQMQYHLPVQSHLSESKSEIDFVRKLRPDSLFYGACYDEFDLFGKNKETGNTFPTIMAHCVWSEPQEISLMAQNGVYIAHCPGSNTNLTSGIAPIRQYLEKGLRVGLGTDVAGGHSASLFRAITDAIGVSKLYCAVVDPDTKPLAFSEAFYMATVGGGSFFGKVGCFLEGYELDAIVLDDSLLPHPQPLNLAERMERAVYLGLDQMGITAKYVAGKALF